MKLCRRDPQTGRFLTRDAKPDQSNPYVPFDPIGMLFAPLGLLAIFFSRRKKGSKWGAWLALLLVVMSVGMTLAACKLPEGEVEVKVTATPGSPVGEGTAVFSDGTTVSGTVPVSPNGTPLIVATPCPTPTTIPTSTPVVKGNENWEGIVNVLWYEGASSFPDFTETVFRKTLWALRSEGKYDPSLQGWSYSQIVQSGRYSASGHFNDAFHPWPLDYVTIAKRILSDQEAPPSQFDQVAIYFISATHFLRRAPFELNEGTPYEDVNSSLIPGHENCPDAGCAFPDIRWRNELYLKSVDREERFIKLARGTYQLHHIEHNQNQYEECYWIGLYFNNFETHNDVFGRGNTQYFEAPNYPIDDAKANELKCPA